MKNTIRYPFFAAICLVGLITCQIIWGQKDLRTLRGQSHTRLKLETARKDKLNASEEEWIADNVQVVDKINSSVRIEVAGNSSNYQPNSVFRSKLSNLPGYFVKDLAVDSKDRGALDKELESRGISLRNSQSVDEWIEKLQSAIVSAKFQKTTTSPVVIKFSDVSESGKTGLDGSIAIEDAIKTLLKPQNQETELAEIAIPIIGSDALISTQSIFMSYSNGNVILEDFRKSSGGTVRLGSSQAVQLKEKLKQFKR